MITAPTHGSHSDFFKSFQRSLRGFKTNQVCFLQTNKINYFKHVLTQGHLEVINHITDAIPDLQNPTLQTELCSLLDQCNVFRRLVQNFTYIALSLTYRLCETLAKNR